MNLLDKLNQEFGIFADDNRVAPGAGDSQISNGNNGLSTANQSLMNEGIFDAWDIVRRAAYPCVFKGLINRQLTNFSFYLDPSIVIGSLMVDQSTLRWTVDPLQVIFDSAGLSTAPTTGDASISVTLNYTPIIGWVIVARAVDTMSGQSKFSLVTSVNGFSGAWQLSDVNKAGALFVWQATRSNTRNIAWVGPDGTATPTADASELIFDPLTSGALVLTGTNVALDVFPVVLTDSVKRALIVAISDDKLNLFATQVAASFAGSI